MNYEVEIQLTESSAETLLNMVLAGADATVHGDLSKFGEEARRNMKEQVAIAVMLYERVTEVFPKVAGSEWVKQFWRDEKKYRNFIEDP